MRSVYRVLAYLLAAEVLIQAMAIAYALAGLGKWVADDGGVLNKAALDSDSLSFTGVGGFAVHGINGMMVIPLLALVLLVVSFFAKVPGGSRRAAILFGMVVVQVALGLGLHGVVWLAPLHVLNGFGILAMGIVAGRAADPVGTVEAPVRTGAAV